MQDDSISQAGERLVIAKLDPDSKTERLQVVAPESWVRRVDEWRRTQPKIPSRSEAIRQLVDAGLAATKGRGGRK